MSDTGVQYSLYEQSRVLANLVREALKQRRQGRRGSREQQQLGESLQRLAPNGTPELAWRVVALRIRTSPIFGQRPLAGVSQALISGQEAQDVIPILEELSRLLEDEQVQTMARIRS